jgi:formylglycine-generating enzyme required for sulfatase activity
MKKTIYILVLATLLLAVFNSCKEKDTNPIKEIRMDKKTLLLAIGITDELTVTIAPLNATDKTVIWSSNNVSVATISSTVEDKGIVTAKASGVATIKVTSKNGEVIATCEVTVISAEPEMVLIEGGTFDMGCTDDECVEYELPTHKVTLSSYKIAKYQVTQQQWEAVMGKNPSDNKGDDHPVEKVSWNSVQQFIQKLNTATGKSYRLPTEAEWEFAARGGNQSKGYKYSGSDDINAVAWHRENSGNRTHPVGKKEPNELGIYDMSGNVFEWCSDWYGLYTEDSQTNPVGPASGTTHIIRGGAFSNATPNRCRVSYRLNVAPDITMAQIGFRLAHP